MVLKTDGSSKLDASEDSNCSGDGLVCIKNMVHDDVKNTIGGSSSMLTVKPPDHCISAIAETRTAVRTLHNSNGYEDIDKLHKDDQNLSRSPCIYNHNLLSNKDAKVVVDNISSDRRDDGANVEAGYCTGGADQKKLSCHEVAVCGFEHEIDEAVTQTSTGSQNMLCDAAKGSADHLPDKSHLVSKSSLGSKMAFAAEDGTDLAEQSDNSTRPAQCVEKLDCLNGLALSAEVEKTSLLSACELEVDESDFEEQDVKVCDICGDAGREDLLAICSRCSDGAEHTYCMREMLRKVPEGDWLCEECKMNAEMEGKKRNHSEMLGDNERDKQQGHTNSITGGSKIKNLDVNKQIAQRRRLSKLEIAPPAKRLALESTVVPTKTCSQKGLGVLPRDNSFKNIEKMKVKSDHHVPTSINSAGGILDPPRSPKTSALHGLKGAFGKSNSFSISNTKPKIKLVDEVPQKQKPAIDAKEGSVKYISKSMSFKGNMARSSTTESKVKMLSPKFVHISDSKGPRQAKESNSFERKNLSKSDSSFAYQVAATSAKHQLRGHNISSLPINSSRDYKNAQSLRPSSHMDRASDAPAIQGDSKRSTTALLSGMNSAAENPSGLKDETIISSQPGEINCLPERSLESSLNCSRQGAYVSSTSGTTSCLAVDGASARSSKEGINEEDKLKAAIEAAMQKKLDIYKRNKVSDKSTELSVSNTDSIPGNASRDRLTKVNFVSNLVSNDEKLEGELASRKFDGHSKQAIMNNNDSQYKAYRTDPVVYSKERLLNSVVHPDGESIWMRPAIPEHEYIWRGGFEVHRDGKVPVLLKGFQAHISTLASYKVLEVAKKLPESILFDEVPRSSAWPLQFQDSGAREDNIALYFFAKDLESYERTYKNLISTMMKDDLALKGNIDDVDLLIFPSDQLAQKCRRWNMMFYLWGVFRGRKRYCLDKTSGSVEKPDISNLNVVLKDKEVRPTLPDGSKNFHLHGPSKEEVCTYGNENSIDSGSETPACADSFILSSSSLSNGGRDGRGNLIAETCLGADTKVECYDRSLNDAGFKKQSCLAARCTSTNVEKDRSVDSKMSVGPHQPNETTRLSEDRSPTLFGPGTFYCSPSTQWGCEHTSEPFSGLHKAAVVHGAVKNGEMDLLREVKHEESCVHAMSDRGQMGVESDKHGEDDMDVDICVQSNDMDVDIPTMDNFVSPKESLHLDSLGSGSQDASARFSERLSWKNGKEGSNVDVQEEYVRKSSIVTDKWYSDNLSSYPSHLGEHFTSRGHGNNDEAFVVNRESTERYFFPVDSYRTESSPTVENSLLRKVVLSERDDRLPDGSPSLELALGVDKRFSSQGGPVILTGIDDKMEQENPPDVETKMNEEDASASLSLSLGFPFTERGSFRLRGSPS